MNKFLLIPLMLLLTFSVASAVPTGGISYYDFSSNTDLWGSNDASTSTATSINVYPSFGTSGDSSPNSYNLDGVNNVVSLGNLGSVKSFGGWIYNDDTIDNTFYGIFELSGSSDNCAFGTISGSQPADTLLGCKTDGTNHYFSFTETQIGVSSISSGWNHYFLVWDSSESNYRLYFNGDDKGLATTYGSTTEFVFSAVKLGERTGAFFDGKIDEFKFFSTELTDTNISNIYEYGVITGSSSSPPFTITAKDFYNDDSINSFWATINGSSNISTTNGTLYTGLLQNNTATHNLLVGASTHFNNYYEAYDISSNLEASLKASDIKFNAFESVSGVEVSANFTIDGVKKSSDESFYLSVDEYTVLVESTGYYSLNYSFNVTAKQNETLNIYNLSNAKYSVIPRDILSNVSISDVNISLSNSTHGFNESFSGVSNATFNVSDGFYFLEVSGGGRVSYNETVYVNTSNSTKYVYLYSLNSLWVKAYSQETSSQILAFNVTVQNDNYSYSNTTSSGTVYINNIMSGTYDVSIIADGYSAGTYTVSITNNSHSDLNAFLSASTDNFIFSVKDKSTNGLLEGATITQKRFVNGSLVTVESKDTDITGRVQFTYTSGVEYTFIATKTDYVTKSFLLTILFDNYNLLLTPEVTANPDIFLDDVSKSIVDYKFINGTSYVVVGFDSPEGSLTSYSVNLSVEGVGYSYLADNNAVGGFINVSLSTPLINYGDKALVTIKYLSSFNSGVKVYTYTYTFTDWIPEDGTVKNFIGELDSYTDEEIVFWATIVYFFIVGIFSLIGLLVNESLLFGSVGGVITTVLLLFGGFISGVLGGMVLFVFVSLIVGRLVSNG